jgi:hypothetical protein
MAGNQEVAEQIAAALRDSGQLHGYRIGVKYQDGTAWLKGHVGTRDEMGTAMQLAAGVPGVNRVVNTLTVRSETPAEPIQNEALLQATGGAISAEQRLPTATRDKTQPNATEIMPNQAQRLATNFTPIAEPQVARTGLEEPTLAPARPVADAGKEVPVTTSNSKAPKPMPMPYTQSPLPMARANGVAAPQAPMAIPAGAAPARYDQPNMPNYAWPSYAAYPNYASLTYPKQYSPTAWPYIGPFYPYPQVPLGWRKVTLEWHDGWWALDFDDGTAKGPFSGLFRPSRRKY